MARQETINVVEGARSIPVGNGWERDRLCLQLVEGHSLSERSDTVLSVLVQVHFDLDAAICFVYVKIEIRFHPLC